MYRVYICPKKLIKAPGQKTEVHTKNTKEENKGYGICTKFSV